MEVRSKRRRYRQAITRTLFSSLTLLILLPFLSEGSSLLFAQDLQEKLRSIEEDIRRYEERLKKEQEKEFSILSELEKINQQLNEIKQKIGSHRSRLRQTEQRLSSTQSEIKGLEASLNKRMEWFKKRLRTLWIYGYTREMEFLLTSRDGGEFLRNLRYLSLLGRYDKFMIEKLRSDIEELKKKEAELGELRKEIRRTLSLIEEEELRLLKTKKEKALLLATVRQKKENYERMLKELNESAKRLTRIIEESKIRGSPEELRRFLSRRGRLSWPVDGKVKIPFGNQKDPLTGVPVFRSGIYITTEDNSEVFAVFSGRVAYTGELKGYGKVIILSHGGDYHTVYANLSEIFFKPGDIIIERRAIGRTGESQIREDAGLYFEIRYKGKPLDPLQWLSKR